MSCNSRTNRISIKWVNHNGWIDIFVIKKTTFLFVFSTYLSVFYSNFEREGSLDEELNFAYSASKEYPHCILLTDPATPKTRNTWKTWWWCHHHVFPGISCFWGSEVRQKYAEWYSLDAESNSASNELSQSKFE